MKIKINKKDISVAITRLSGIVQSRTTIPIIQNFKLSSEDGSLKITATDLEIEASVTIPCVSEDDGETTIPAQAFSDIVKNASSDELALTVSGEKATLSAGRSRFSLGTLPAGDFPHMDMGKAVRSFSILAHEFHHLLGDAITCASNEETLYYLNGVYVHAKDGKMTSCATDGHRLALSTSVEIDEMPSVIIPRKTVGIVMKSFSGNDDLHVSFSDNLVKIESEGITVISKLVDGTYPDYERIVPRDFKHSFCVDAGELASAVTRVSVAQTEETSMIVADIVDNVLTLKARSATGDAVDEVDTEGHSGSVTIGFNGNYLRDVLKCVGGKIIVSYNDPSGACLVHEDGVDNQKFIIMPMRVGK